MTVRWESVPTVDYADQASWRTLGNARYAALRLRLAFVCTNGQGSRLGPVVEEHRVARGDKITVRRRRERVVTRTQELSAAVRTASTLRLCESLSAQVSSELSAKIPGFSGKIASQALTSSEYELTEELERTLSSTASHSIQETEGQEHEIVLDGAGGHRLAELRRVYRPRRWNVYLHSLDYVELSWRRRWLWKQVRETMKRIDGMLLGWPLASIVFYEPQSDPVVSYGPVGNELENPEAVEIVALAAPIPAMKAPALESLEMLAKLAFPITRAERATASARVKPGSKAIGFSSGRRGGSGKTGGSRTKKKKGARKRTGRPRAAKSSAARKRVKPGASRTASKKKAAAPRRRVK